MNETQVRTNDCQRLLQTFKWLDDKNNAGLTAQVQAQTLHKRWVRLALAGMTDDLLTSKHAGPRRRRLWKQQQGATGPYRRQEDQRRMQSPLCFLRLTLGRLQMPPSSFFNTITPALAARTSSFTASPAPHSPASTTIL